MQVAAQNCRKRKIETISNMEDDVEVMRTKKQQLVDEQKELEIQYESIKLQYSALYRQVKSPFFVVWFEMSSYKHRVFVLNRSPFSIVFQQ